MEDPPVSLAPAEQPNRQFFDDHCWRDQATDIWMTNFAPPPGVDDDRHGAWRKDDYERACTAEEADVLDAFEAADLEADRAGEEAARVAWFAMLKESIDSAPAIATVETNATSGGTRE